MVSTFGVPCVVGRCSVVAASLHPQWPLARWVHPLPSRHLFEAFGLASWPLILLTGCHGIRHFVSHACGTVRHRVTLGPLMAVCVLDARHTSCVSLCVNGYHCVARCGTVLLGIPVWSRCQRSIPPAHPGWCPLTSTCKSWGMSLSPSTTGQVRLLAALPLVHNRPGLPFRHLLLSIHYGTCL